MNTASLDPRTPVLVGVATASESAEPAALMAQALQAAADDATGSQKTASALLGALERVAVPQGTWGYPDPGRLVASWVGAPNARTVYVELGIPQQTLINQALADVAAGTVEVAAVVGGEARAWARGPEGGPPPTETAQPQARPDERQSPAVEIMSPAELAVGLTSPVSQYAMIDNALRAAEHRSVEEHRQEVAELWGRFNKVAQSNPKAAFPEPRSAHQIEDPGPGNRPLAFPYNKWHASQWTVDQAAALIICSLDAAQRLGIPPDRCVFPLVGLESSQAVTLTRRQELSRWPAMGVLGRAAAGHLGVPLAHLDPIETYSCFPAAVRVQQRELALAVDGTPTVTGGMPFAGGPLNNFVLQATAAVVAELRRRPGAVGLITTVSGILTKPGLAVWCTQPQRPLLLGDLAEQAAQVTATVEVVPEHRGSGVVATYTVVHHRPQAARPPRLIALLDLPDGRRCLASTENSELVAHAGAQELIGTRFGVEGTALVP